MGNVRTSNKDIAEKLDTLIAVLTANARLDALPSVTAEPVITTASTQTMAQEPTDHKVDAKYMAHMESKLTKLVANDGQARVLYLRRNLSNEVKLAYALKTRWDAGIKDNGMIGAVKVFA